MNYKEICTTYIALEIREPIYGDSFTPLVIMSEKSETKERRRIEVLNRSSNNYETAKKLIAGDTFSLVEWVFDDDRRVMKELVVYFREEEI